MRGAARRPLLAALCVTMIVVSTAGVVAGSGAGTVAADVPERALVVALHEDGSADVRVTYTYDLADESERQALQDLREDESARDALADRFAERLARVADATTDRTDRPMTVEDPRIEVVTEGDRGAVTVTVTWHGLAAVDGDELTVTEPFASEFAPDRELRVVAPDGYAIDAASPTPDADDGDAVAWSAGSDLSGFAVTASPDGASGALGPGFGVGAALTGVGIVAILGLRGSRP